MAALHGDEQMQRILALIIRQLRPETVVETGTFHGDSARWFAAEVRRHVPLGTVLTCEIRDDFADQARAALDGHGVTNVELRRGSSAEHLPLMLRSARHLGGACLVFLDAHWQDAWPLAVELEACRRARDELFAGHLVVVVDDFEVPGRPNFSAPEGGGGTPGHPTYGPRVAVDRTPASLATFAPELRSWPELWFPDYDGAYAGYAIASGVPLALQGCPVRQHRWEG